MYEPFEEVKSRVNFGKISEKLRGLKEKLGKLKEIKVKRWLAIVIAIIAISAMGGYTGWVSYTSKIEEFQSKNIILEKQVKACENNLTSCFSSLESIRSEVSGLKSEKEKCESDLESVSSKLEECKSEKEDLEEKVVSISTELETCKSSLEEKKSEFESLKEDYEKLECNFAKEVCGSAGMKYYFVEDGNVFCCIKKDRDFCTERPENEDLIKEITC